MTISRRSRHALRRQYRTNATSYTDDTPTVHAHGLHICLLPPLRLRPAPLRRAAAAVTHMMYFTPRCPHCYIHMYPVRYVLNEPTATPFVEPPRRRPPRGRCSSGRTSRRRRLYARAVLVCYLCIIVWTDLAGGFRVSLGQQYWVLFVARMRRTSTQIKFCICLEFSANILCRLYLDTLYPILMCSFMHGPARHSIDDCVYRPRVETTTDAFGLCMHASDDRS